jgi:hypothetical protein
MAADIEVRREKEVTMVNAQDLAQLEAAVQRAEAALAAFDVDSLITDDGTYDDEAVARHERLKAAVVSTKTQLAEARPQ